MGGGRKKGGEDMGFGLLLCSYFMLTLMAFGMAEYSFAVYIIAGIVSIKATWSLKDYCPTFSWATIVSVLYILLGVYHGVDFLSTMFLWDLLPTEGWVVNAISAATYAIELAYHVVILFAITQLAGELGMVKITARAKTNLILAVIWGVGQAVLVAYPPLAQMQAQLFPKMLLLWALICYILNTFLLHSCYQNICPAGEEFGKEKKPSRFKFVNRINQKLDERSAKALQETLDYQAEKQRKRQERKQHKKKK